MPLRINDLIKKLYPHIKLILAVCGIVFFGSVVIVLLKPNYYQAETIFYPASEDLAKPEFIFGMSNSDMNYYGSDFEADRLISTGHSLQFAARMIDSFELMSHYEIDPASGEAFERCMKRFFKCYRLLKNELDALELTVEDTDPVKAAAMANGARNILDNMAADFIKSSQQGLFNNLRASILAKERLLDTVITNIQNLKKQYEIIDTETQAEQIAERLTDIQHGIVSAKSRLAAFKNSQMSRSIRDSIQKMEILLESRLSQLEMMKNDTGSTLNLERFSQGKEKVENQETYFRDLKNQLSRDLLRLNQIGSTMESDIPSVIVIQEASVPEEKSGPRRSLIVLAATFGALIFTLLGLLLYESAKELDWKPDRR